MACGIGLVSDETDRGTGSGRSPRSAFWTYIIIFSVVEPLLHTITQNRSTHSHHSGENEGQKYAVIKGEKKREGGGRRERGKEGGWGQKTKAELCN